MSLGEILVLEVGASIAKSMLKLWLKTDIISEASSSLVDVLKSQITNKIDQHRAQRQFEAIGEKVSESLLPIFEIEGVRLDEGSRIAVAKAVAETLNTAKISSRLLASLNLDPTNLAKYIRSANENATQHFGTEEIALYERIIDESCEYIVDIASQLPSYNEQTLSEVLKRENQLLDKAEQVLTEVQGMREQLNPKALAAHFELEYRRAIVRNLDILQLFGTDVSAISRRQHLSVAYVTLTVEQRSSKTPGKDASILSINEALATSKRLLIRGFAGSGKTTLLQWIAVRSASRTFEHNLSNWNNTIPFYIRLRQFAQIDLPTPESFPRSVAPVIADTMPQGWVHQQLESGRAIVLVDGLDEVPTLKRDEVHLWFKELIDTYPHARFIITSRPYAAEENWMEKEGLRNAELQPMSLSDIHAFIDHWHKAIQEDLAEEEVENFQALTKHLKEEVTYNRSKRILATNPLLCAMLCALNRDRQQQIPSDRIELYEACCSMLIERRDKERHIELAEYPALNYRQKRVLLEYLAYWMIKNGKSEVGQKDADDCFARKLANMQDIPNNTSGKIMRLFFIQRTGLLREPAVDQVDFTHRSFQEFLAAYSAVDEAEIGLLVKHAHDDQWREVIIVAAGLASKPLREELIKGLITRGDREPSYRHQLHLLAISCLESTVELDQGLRKALEARLKDLVPPKNRAEAKALAVAGELVVPFLSKRQRYTALVAASCVRTLAIIGSEAALEALENYAHDERSTVTSELFRAFDFFEKETYIRRILSRTLQGKYSLPMNFTDLYIFGYFPELTSLNLSKCELISDLRPLSKLKNLHTLNLALCSSIEDLTPLTSLIQLKYLNLFSCKRIKDISILANLTQLQELNLWSCENIVDLGPISNLTQLKTLILSWRKQLKDLSILSNLKLLEFLDLTACNRISNLEPLRNLTELATLNLYECFEISDLSPLAELKNLKTLDLSFCTKVKDLSPLIGLKNLSRLNLTGISHQLLIPQTLKEQLKVNKYKLLNSQR